MSAQITNGTLPFVVFGEEWGHHPTSTQHLARRLAATNPLLYVNTVGLRPPRLSAYDLRRAFKVALRWASPNGKKAASGPPNLHFYSPVRIPWNSVRMFRRWNKRTLLEGLRQQLRQHGFGSPVLSVTLPVGGEVAGELGEQLLIYYVTDNYEEMPGWDRGYVREMEQLLLSEADLVFVTSIELQAKKNGKKSPAIMLPHGVDFEHFRQAVSQPAPIPEELRELPRPILGFYGLLAPWVDMDLMQQVARAFPQASVVLIGPQWNDCPVPRGAPNFHWLGPRTYENLPRYAAHFDVGMIPFRKDQLTAYTNPLKLLEYMALGMPVVSTPLPDLRRFGDLVFPASSVEEFVHQVRRALEDRTPERRKQRLALAASESWDARVATLREYVEIALRKRKVA